jgi:RNA 3'-terminal phosphate cyclase (ATP)
VIEIDGSFGEGGGQILRTSLSLSLITQTPFRLTNIRTRRKKPGLQRQHRTAVRAAVELGSAEVTGDELGSTVLEFRPGKVNPGDYRFAIGTAGSTSLVFQTVLMPLVLAGGRSKVIFEGGTHNTGAPPYDFVAKAFVPLINRMGGKVRVNLERHGFVPLGGGRWIAEIEGSRGLRPLELHGRGIIRESLVRALVSKLPDHIAEREIEAVRKALTLPAVQYGIERVDAAGSGNILLIEVRSDHVTEVFTGFGERGVPAERVAASAVDCATAYLNTAVPVGEHLADQLMLPIALAGAGSYTTLKPTLHATTNAEVIRRFLPIAFDFAFGDENCTVSAVTVSRPV